MKWRSAIARRADELLLAREAQGAASALIALREQGALWAIDEAQLLRELADAVEAGEITVTAVEVER